MVPNDTRDAAVYAHKAACEARDAAAARRIAAYAAGGTSTAPDGTAAEQAILNAVDFDYRATRDAVLTTYVAAYGSVDTGISEATAGAAWPRSEGNKSSVFPQELLDMR